MALNGKYTIHCKLVPLNSITEKFHILTPREVRYLNKRHRF